MNVSIEIVFSIFSKTTFWTYVVYGLYGSTGHQRFSNVKKRVLKFDCPTLSVDMED